MGVLTKEDKDFLRDLVNAYFGSKLGAIQALNGGGAFTLTAATPAQIMEQNENRNVATIVNADVALTVFLNFSGNTAVTNTGIMLLPGGSITFGRGTDIPYTGRVWAISAGAATVVFTELSL